MSDGVGDVVALAEHLGAPVINTYLHNDSFPCDHPLWAGPIGYQGSKAAMKLLAQADVVLCLGTRLGPFGTASAARNRLLARKRENHSGGSRPAKDRPGPEGLGRRMR